MENLNRKSAIQIIQHLRSGTPPPARLIPHLHVGRERWLEGMAWYLDNAREADLSAARFVVGEYGSGKTHFLHMTSHMALERRFVVCEVTLSRDVRLDRFDTIWRAMMSTLATPESESEPEGIGAILNRWCEQATQQPEQLPQELARLDGISKLDPDFRKAMRGYLQAYVQDGDRDSYLQWLKGDAIRPSGVKMRIDRASARAMLRSLIYFFKYLGYSGMVLFLDELELILTQSYRVRDASYDVLRQFIDDADKLRRFLLLCSVTPNLWTDSQHGFPSYPALWERVGGMSGSTKGDYRAIAIDLDAPEAQLSSEDLLEMAKQLRKVHAVAEAWDAQQAVPDDFLSEIVSAARQSASELSQPRLVVQATICLLEAKQQNPDRELHELLPEMVRQAVRTIRDQERAQHRPWGT